MFTEHEINMENYISSMQKKEDQNSSGSPGL